MAGNGKDQGVLYLDLFHVLNLCGRKEALGYGIRTTTPVNTKR